jgi:hypothetical protein
MAKEIQKKENTELVTINFTADIGAGMEGTDKDSFAIPFLKVIQSNSPQVTRNESEYMPDAKPGMFLNTVTNELFDGDEGVVFLPCSYQRRFIQWAPRGDSAGYKGEHMPEEIAMKRDAGEITELDGRLYLTKGTPNPKEHDSIVDTRNHFGILIGEKSSSKVLMSLSSTQIKKSKQLMSMLSEVKIDTPQGLVTPPTWMNKIRLKTVPESNDQGSWFGIKVENEGFIKDPELYKLGKEFHETVTEGQAKVVYKKEDDVEENF